MKPDDFLPRKLDIVEAEENPDLWQIIPKIEVTCNGEVQDACTAYNLDEGWIARYKKDEGGKVIINPLADILEVERVYSNDIKLRWLDK